MPRHECGPGVAGWVPPFVRDALELVLWSAVGGPRGGVGKRVVEGGARFSEGAAGAPAFCIRSAGRLSTPFARLCGTATATALRCRGVHRQNGRGPAVGACPPRAPGGRACSGTAPRARGGSPRGTGTTTTRVLCVTSVASLTKSPKSRGAGIQLPAPGDYSPAVKRVPASVPRA